MQCRAAGVKNGGGPLRLAAGAVCFAAALPAVFVVKYQHVCMYMCNIRGRRRSGRIPAEPRLRLRQCKTRGLRGSRAANLLHCRNRFAAAPSKGVRKCFREPPDIYITP